MMQPECVVAFREFHKVPLCWFRLLRLKEKMAVMPCPIVIAFVSMTLFVHSAHSQKHPNKIKYQNITISSAEEVLKFRTTNDLSPKVRTRNERWYHWYHPHGLHRTAGNFHGRLLDGPYTSLYPNGALKEKGQFRKGLRTDEWMKWYDNGQILEVADYRKGERHGAYVSYDPNGNTMIQGYFKRGTYVGLKRPGWDRFVDIITFRSLRGKRQAKLEPAVQ